MAEKVAILGAGHQGMTMAAHLSNNSVDCYLWNRTAANIDAIEKCGKITCQGIIEKKVRIHQISTDIKKSLQKTIMITTPSSAHRDIAATIAPYVDESYTVILNPGRTFGILDFLHALKQAGCKSFPCVAEAQSIIYTCRRCDEKTVKLFALKKGIKISALKSSELPRVMDSLPECIRGNFTAEENYMVTSLGNVGMILHCAPVLMNIGWIESNKTKFEYYYDGISKSIASVLEKIDSERLGVAEAMGINIESVAEWLKRCYNTSGENLFDNLQNNVYYRGIDAPQSIQHRYIEEDVPNGLVPLESLGVYLDIPTPVTSTIISLANIVMNCDYRKTGRNYVTLKHIENIFK